MDRTGIDSQVKSFIVENFLLGATDELDDDTQLMEAGILDSTGVMELVAFLETNFDIAIDEEEIIPENLNSLHYISGFVVRKSN